MDKLHIEEKRYFLKLTYRLEQPFYIPKEDLSKVSLEYLEYRFNFKLKCNIDENTKKETLELIEIISNAVFYGGKLEFYNYGYQGLTLALSFDTEEHLDGFKNRL